MSMMGDERVSEFPGKRKSLEAKSIYEQCFPNLCQRVQMRSKWEDK
jgi:hypothetical protein